MRDLVLAPSREVQDIAHARLQQTMALAGWFIDYVDLDLTQARPVVTVKCHRDDGRWLRAGIDALGRCTLETFQRQSWLGRPKNAKGRWPMSPQIDDLFLGRLKPAGPRAMLRAMVAYIADNATGQASLGDMRSAWGGILNAPARIGNQNERTAA